MLRASPPSRCGFPNGTRLLTEGDFSGVSIFAIQDDFADYLTAVHRALDGDYEPLLALTEAKDRAAASQPARWRGGAVRCRGVQRVQRTVRLDDKLSKRKANFRRRLAGLPADAFGWFSKRGWVDSSWEQVDFCLRYPKPRFSAKLRPPTTGPFPKKVPVLMLNGDIDLQSPLESARRAKKDWPKSVL